MIFQLEANNRGVMHILTLHVVALHILFAAPGAVAIDDTVTSAGFPLVRYV